MALTGPALHRREALVNLGKNRPFVVKTGSTIYQGAAVGLDAGTGTATPVSAGTYPFIGFARETAFEGQSVAISRGSLWLIPLAGADATDTDAIVYATDDDTFSLSSTAAVQIGRLYRFSTEDVNPAGYVWVDSGSDWHNIS
jgi:hypothetical protein